MQAHEENVEAVFAKTQEKLAKNINEAEHRKELPDEAVVVTITNSIVFWGNEMERKRFKRKWVHQQSESMKGELRYQLKTMGRTISVRPIGDGKGEIWNIWDTADVHMTKEAKARLEEHATPEAVAKIKEIEKQAKEEEDVHLQKEAVSCGSTEIDSKDEIPKKG